ncbi:hypothetical protein D9M71_303430 [compost metagenome]
MHCGGAGFGFGGVEYQRFVAAIVLFTVLSAAVLFLAAVGRARVALVAVYLHLRDFPARHRGVVAGGAAAQVKRARQQEEGSDNSHRQFRLVEVSVFVCVEVALDGVVVSAEVRPGEALGAVHLHGRHLPVGPGWRDLPVGHEGAAAEVKRARKQGDGSDDIHSQFRLFEASVFVEDAVDGAATGLVAAVVVAAARVARAAVERVAGVVAAFARFLFALAGLAKLVASVVGLVQGLIAVFLQARHLFAVVALHRAGVDAVHARHAWRWGVSIGVAGAAAAEQADGQH